MFFIALLFLILLVIVVGTIVVLNGGTLLSTSVHLTLLSWHLPGIPVLLLFVLGIFLGGLLLYVIAAHSARRDKLEMKILRMRIDDLEKASAKSPSGGLSTSFAPPVVPMPGLASGGPVGPSGPANLSSSAGSIGPGPAGSIGPGPVGPGPSQWQTSANSLQNMSPSSSGNNLSLPPRLFQSSQPPQPQQPQQMGGPRPPFPHA